MKEKQRFERVVVSREEALAMFQENKFKVDIISGLQPVRAAPRPGLACRVRVGLGTQFSTLPGAPGVPLARRLLLYLVGRSLSPQGARRMSGPAARAQDATISLYRCGPMVDLCTGPHLPNTGYLKAAAVHSMSRAFWRADVKREPLQVRRALLRPHGLWVRAQRARLEGLRGGPGASMPDLSRQGGTSARVPAVTLA